MQTFLPYPDFKQSAMALDYRRLGKQRVEAYQILNTIKNGSGWKNHPAVLMWIGYENALKDYYNHMVKEWINRGYKNNMKLIDIQGEIVMPWWLGNEDFHRAMRARLIEKNEDFYSSIFFNDKGFNDGKYLWPVNEKKSFKMI